MAEIAKKTPEITQKPTTMQIVSLAALFGAIVLNYTPTILDMADRWSIDPRYSHGFLVPAFALFLLWHRKAETKLRAATPLAQWVGVGVVAFAAVMQFGGIKLFINYAEHLSLLVSLTGATLILGGWSALKLAWPSIAFLLFMIPLPYRIEVAAGQPLQLLATETSTYVLQTLGQPAFSEGTVINLNRSQIGVVEACNGLGMLFTFSALSTAVALVLQRPLVDRLIILASAVPISFIANVLRIAGTGLLLEYTTDETAKHFYHDLAGWLMMPVALVMLWLEILLLSKLIIEEDAPTLAPIRLDMGLARPQKP